MWFTWSMDGKEEVILRTSLFSESGKLKHIKERTHNCCSSQLKVAVCQATTELCVFSSTKELKWININAQTHQLFTYIPQNWVVQAPAKNPDLPCGNHWLAASPALPFQKRTKEKKQKQIPSIVQAVLFVSFHNAPRASGVWGRNYFLHNISTASVKFFDLRYESSSSPRLLVL